MESSLTQDIDTSAYAAAPVSLWFRDLVRVGAGENPSDLARFVVEVRDTANMNTLYFVNYGTYPFSDQWFQQEPKVTNVVGSHRCRVRLTGTRNSGTTNDCFYDDISCRIAGYGGVRLRATMQDDWMPGDKPAIVQWSKISGPGTVVFEDAKSLNTSAVFNAPGSYILRITAADGQHTSSDDITVTVAPFNAAPTIDAGPDREIRRPIGELLVSARITDDGLPADGVIKGMWTTVSGTKATFDNPFSPTTTVRFPANTTYTLRYTVTDGLYSVSDDLNVTVRPENEPPVVNMGPAIAVAYPDGQPVTLSPTVTDDGYPAGSTLSYAWTKWIGPGTVQFSAPNAASTTATFSAPGTYILFLTVSDGSLTTSGGKTVTLRTPPAIALSAPFAGQLIAPNQSFQIVAAALSEGSISKVEFLIDGVNVGQDTASPYLYNWVPTEGVHTISARATDNLGISNSTGPISVTVASDPGVPPSMEIVQPIGGDTVTAPVAIIGSVESTILKSWRLEYKRVSQTCPEWVAFAEGNAEVHDDVLGTFDTTKLKNGLYAIRLVASDLAGRTVTLEPVHVTVDGGMKVGHFTVAFSDLTIPMSGIDLTISRTYDSRDKCSGDFGVGWNLDLNTVRLEKSHPVLSNWVGTVNPPDFQIGVIPVYCVEDFGPKTVNVTFPDGKVMRFVPAIEIVDKVSPPPPLVDNTGASCQMAAEPAPEARMRLVFRPLSGTQGTLIAKGLPEYLYRFDTFIGDMNFSSEPQSFDVVPEPSGFDYISQSGQKFTFDANGKLVSMSDRNGNALTITENGVFHSSGQAITWTRDTQGRITKVTDPKGNEVLYTYTAGNDLDAVTDRVGETISFTYNAEHDITRIEDPRGVEPIRNEYDAEGRLTRHVDADGKTILYTHNLSGRTETITDRLGNTTVMEYDLRGNVTREVDALGHATIMTYDDRDNKLTETNALGHITRYTYDSRELVTEIRDPLGNLTRLTYDDFGNPLTITDARGKVTESAYNAQGNLIRMKDVAGNVTEYQYDAAGNRTYEKNALGHETHYVFDGFGRMTEMTDALGHSTSYTYDANGNQLTQTTTRAKADGTVETITSRSEYDALDRLVKTINALEHESQTVYNEIGKTEKTIDPLGRETRFEYDRQGRLAKTIHPDGLFEQTIYDHEGRRIESIDRSERSTKYTYDKVGRLTKTTFADNTYTETIYDAAGRVEASIDAAGNRTEYTYDNAGRRTKVKNALGQITKFAYDANGNQVSFTDALDRVTLYVYDDLNRRTETWFSDGTKVKTVYDALGRRISEIDQSNRLTKFHYDELGRLIKVTDALGQETSYSYDELGNQLTQTDALNRTTCYEYDVLGRRIRRILPMGQVEEVVYNAVGNTSTRTDFNGKTTTYVYDNLNRLVEKRPDATLGEPTVSFTYNAAGQRASMIDATGATMYGYDIRHRLTSKATPFGTLNYTYNTVGNLAGIASSNANGVSIGYRYDTLNRLAYVDDANLGTTSYQYDEVGNLKSYQYPNGVTTSYQYNGLNRLTDMAITSPVNPTTPIASYQYSLAPTGHRLSAVETTPGITGPSLTRTVAYEYDATYRLTKETITGSGPGPLGVLSYTHDAVGNRLTRNSTVAGIPSQTLGYDANDRLTNHQYDANGNTRGSESGSDQYNFEDRLVQRTKPDGSTVRLVYDGDGNLVQEITDEGTITYLVDTLNPTGYAQVVEELVNSTISKVYCYGHDLISLDLADGDGTFSASFYGYDGHGSVRFLIGESGEVTDTYIYEAFGQSLSREGSTRNDYLVNGERFLSSLSLYSLRARFMSASYGRFWTMDSFTGNYNDPRSLHKYVYCNSDPINNSDPSGFFTVNQVMLAASLTSLVVNLGFAAWDFHHTLTAPTMEEKIFHSILLTVDLVGAATSFIGAGGSGPGWRLALVQGRTVGYAVNLGYASGSIGVLSSRIIAAMASNGAGGGGVAGEDVSSQPHENSAGDFVEREYVGSDEALLKQAEDAAGGDLNKWDEIKWDENSNWFMSPDKNTKIEWSPTGHRSTNEGPHVKILVRKVMGDAKSGWKTVRKIFITGRDKYSN